MNDNPVGVDRHMLSERTGHGTNFLSILTRSATNAQILDSICLETIDVNLFFYRKYNLVNDHDYLCPKTDSMCHSATKSLWNGVKNSGMDSIWNRVKNFGIESLWN